jgi:hypothetical protein
MTNPLMSPTIAPTAKPASGAIACHPGTRNSVAGDDGILKDCKQRDAENGAENAAEEAWQAGRWPR